MRLTDLKPQFVRYEVVNGRVHHVYVDSLAEAQGVGFLCPSCFLRNGGPQGTHHILAWFQQRGVPPDAVPGPGRWGVGGTSYADLTLNPSVDVGCWHGFIFNGAIT